MRALFAILLALVLSGCLGGIDNPLDGGPRASEPWLPPHTYVPPDQLTPLRRDPLSAQTNATHSHANPAHHRDSHNVETLGYLAGGTGQSFSELDIVGDYAYQCMNGGRFRILDISNRSQPVEVAVHTGTTCADVKVTSDGAYAFVMGREIVDVRDKTSPSQVTAASGASCHMCYVKTIGDKEYFFAARDAPHEIPFGTGVGIYEFTRDPPQLTRISSYIVPPEKRVNTHMPDGDAFAHQVHDITVYDDPLLNKTIMLAAYWDLGVRIVDVTDPRQPRELGAWDDFQGDLGDIHTVGVDFIDGRRIIAAGTENGLIIDPVGSASGYSVGYVYLIDATNPARPVTLGKWLNPGKHSSGPEPVGIYSMHNLQFLQGRVYLAHYHAGVWVLDAASYVKSARADPLRTLQKNDNVLTLGFAFTTTTTATNVWDVVVKDGYLYASDIGNGLHALHFYADPLGDPRFTSFG